jgi:hypothetical protein
MDGWLSQILCASGEVMFVDGRPKGCWLGQCAGEKDAEDSQWNDKSTYKLESGVKKLKS